MADNFYWQGPYAFRFQAGPELAKCGGNNGFSARRIYSVLRSVLEIIVGAVRLKEMRDLIRYRAENHLGWIYKLTDRAHFCSKHFLEQPAPGTCIVALVDRTKILFMQWPVPLTLRYQVNPKRLLRIQTREGWVLNAIDVRTLFDGAGHFLQQL
jgi:hypothetical protein